MDKIRESNYLPVLALRPAEVKALKELPEKDKDFLLPAIQLKPWMSSKEFSNSVDKVVEALGENRQWIANLDEVFTREIGEEAVNERNSLTTFRSLTRPDNAYENWCDFIERTENAIPCIQHRDRTNLGMQTQRLAKLGRGLVIHMRVDQLLGQQHLIDILNQVDDSSLLIIFDFGEIGLEQWDVSNVIDSINIVTSIQAKCSFAISATSFSAITFMKGSHSHQIYERDLFDYAQATLGSGHNLIYSDRASTRIEKLGGGGVPLPRIDYAKKLSWFCIKSELTTREREDRGISKVSEYQNVAAKMIASSSWNNSLALWGTDMIVRTATKHENGINSPASSTAVRINLHLHQQIYFNNQALLTDTDDDWVD